MFSNFVHKASKILFCALIIFTLFSILLTEYQNEVLLTSLSSIPYIIGGCVIIVLVYLCFSKFRGVKCSPSWIMAIISVVFCGVLCFLTYNYYFYTAWDCGAVVNGANTLAQGEPFDYYLTYFSRCSNNLFLTCFYSVVIRCITAIGVKDYYFSCIVFQCILFSVTGYLLYRVVGMMTDKRGGLTAYVIYVLLVAFSPWVTVPYSDATGLFFPVLFIYLYETFCKSNSIWARILLPFLIGFFSVVAFKIKPQLFIVVIAIVIIEFSNFLSSKNKNEWLLPSASFVLSIVVGLLAVSVFISSFNIELNKEADYSIWYYLCIGANDEYDGVCNVPDQTFALSYENKAERDDALRELFFERLQENGIVGTIKLVLRKNRLNYNDGTFGWWMEDGDFFYRSAPERGESSFRGLLCSFYYYNGINYWLFKAISRALWFGVLLLCVFNLSNRNCKQSVDVAMLAIIGLSIFEMIFESRARYLFAYTPMYAGLAVCGIDALANKLHKGKKLRRV